MRYDAKTDGNQKVIVAGLRKCGYVVALIHRNGMGVPDLLVAKEGNPQNFLLEVKMPGEKLDERETEFHAEWPGQIAIVHSLEESLEAMS